MRSVPAMCLLYSCAVQTKLPVQASCPEVCPDLKYVLCPLQLEVTPTKTMALISDKKLYVKALFSQVAIEQFKR